MSRFSRSAARATSLPGAALCALAAHAAVYRAFFPAAAEHSYFRWYEPLVAAASGAAAIGLLALAGLAFAARRHPLLVGVLRRLLPPDSSGRGTSDAVARLAVAGLVLLVLQESAEASLAAGRAEAASLGGGQWLLALAALALAALVLASARSLCWKLVRVGIAALEPRDLAGRAPALARPAPPRRSRRRSALARHRGLRAPPLPAV